MRICQDVQIADVNCLALKHSAINVMRQGTPRLDKEPSRQPFKPLALAWLGLLALVNGGAVVVLWNWRTRKLM